MSSARVWAMDMRSPTPWGPPDQPVFNRMQRAAWASIAVGQQFGVHRWLVRHERGPEAGAERGLGLHHANLGAGQLGGEPHHEVVHHLVAVEDRHRRQHPEGIRGQQHDGAGVRPSGAGGHMGVARQRVGEAGVLGDGAVGEVEFLGIGVGQIPAGQGRYVLDEGSRHRQGGGDDGLGIFVKVNELGVAAVLEVGHPRLGPHVLVVADQAAVGVG